ncbi:MAG: tetratricopeptide repeat protein [Bryobacterales bacterium]|nr:tetratricopeptide repeat protein [Bryobacterales bacterium]
MVLAAIGLSIIGTGSLTYSWLSQQNNANHLQSTDSAKPAKFTDAQLCQPCHSDIWDSYQQTGMARSFYRLRPENTVEDYNHSDAFRHAASDRYYRMVLRDGRYFQRRHQIDARGSEINVLEREIHFVLGSGNHARSYLHLAPSGKLTQLPLGWYAEDDGRWGMSPGYDRPNHDGFQRVVAYDCMFCHNAYPTVAPKSDRPGRLPRYTGEIPEGIDCQRCHGPGSDHVAAATESAAEVERIKTSIVNPANLSPEAAMEVCMQCHLEPTSRPLPNIVHKYGRGYFSYRAGEPLSAYALYFDHAAGTGWDDKFEINHSAYGLRQSLCFVESGESLTCIDCHDPHKPSQGAEASERYDAACLECHQTRMQVLWADGQHSSKANCASCHMPKRRTDDVVHAVMTDHRIQARPALGLLRPKAERSTLREVSYEGTVVPYYPATADALYSAVAQVAQGSNLAAGIERLESAIGDHNPDDAEFYFDLGAAYHDAGELEKAANWLRQAVASDTSFVLARVRLGSVLSQAGNFRQAEQVLRTAAELAADDPRVARELGLHYARQGLYEQAAEASRTGIALDPDLPEFHNNLGGALGELGRFDEAAAALRQAIRLQPDLADAQFNLGNILAAQGRTQEGVRHWLSAIRSQPGHAGARYNYAVVLASSGDYDRALKQLEAALRSEPDFEQALDLKRALTANRGSN